MLGRKIGRVQRGKAPCETQEIGAVGTVRVGAEGVPVGLQEAVGEFVQPHVDLRVLDNLGSTPDGGCR